MSHTYNIFVNKYIVNKIKNTMRIPKTIKNAISYINDNNSMRDYLKIKDLLERKKQLLYLIEENSITYYINDIATAKEHKEYLNELYAERINLDVELNKLLENYFNIWE